MAIPTEPIGSIPRPAQLIQAGHDLVAEAGQRAVSAGLPLRDVLLAVPKLEGRLASAGITPEQIESALEPAGYLGAADAFVTAALQAHDALDAQLSEG